MSELTYMSSADLRSKFLEFFAGKGHTVVPSSSLVPADDPTLLFTNSGMVQFKEVFTGQKQLPFKRATTAQKCVRAGGKHNDLENVGKTARHHTFFEMLGNFSFGDYFKREAIAFAWEFVTEWLGLPKDKLWITIYKDDDESFTLWQEVAGVPAQRIVRMGEKDNFWAMGETGPCGPCSEIHYDRGPGYPCESPECGIGLCDCDRWFEIWNLVFMQFERDAEGNLTPLPKPSIDTGLGLERVASLMQGVESNWDTDLFRPLLHRVEELARKTYHPGPEGFPFRVIADHARACTFLIADGVFPSNEGRGYVLRRILRRAVRFGRLLGLQKPFLHHMVATVVNVLGQAYPEIVERQAYVERVIGMEEERFGATLEAGLGLLEEVIAATRAAGRGEIAGDQAFRLYDTYGFPLDLLIDAAEEAGLTVDRKGFEVEMANQRARARADRKAKAEVQGLAGSVLEDLPEVRFVGYDQLTTETEIVLLLDGEERLTEARAGDDVEVILAETPFYAEGGGQVSDRGWLVAADGRGEVTGLRRAGGLFIHRVRVREGRLRLGENVRAQVDADRRRDIMRNHSATHLLHKALKEVLGPHANQAGSLVASERLRFDFSHFAPLQPQEIDEVERRVNAAILAAMPIRWYETGLADAKAQGAMALFGEKYGDRVRVVQMGDYSLELCGGTHVGNTSEIGLFRILGEGSVGSGVRRLEAVTGNGLLALVRERDTLLQQAAQTIKARPEELPTRVNELAQRLEAAERELTRLRQQQAAQAGNALLANARPLAEGRAVVGQVDVTESEALRALVDQLRARLGEGAVVLGSVQGERAQVVVGVTPGLLQRGAHAGKAVAEAARAMGGGGGGRPEFAQAGGKEPAKLEQALEAAFRALRRQLENGVTS